MELKTSFRKATCLPPVTVGLDPLTGLSERLSSLPLRSSLEVCDVLEDGLHAAWLRLFFLPAGPLADPLLCGLEGFLDPELGVFAGAFQVVSCVFEVFVHGLSTRE